MTVLVVLGLSVSPLPMSASSHVLGRAAQAAAPAPRTAPDADWLTTVNDYRVASGLAPVTEEPAWTAGLAHHLTYLKNTPASYYVDPYRSVHTENPASPWYTADGKDGAAASNIGPDLGARGSIDAWMAAPYHAIGLLRPNLQRSAFASGEGRALVDVIRGLGAPPAVRPTIVFPGPNSISRLTRFRAENPDPREGCASDWKNFKGLPMFAMLPAAPPAGTTATLTGPDGVTVAQGNDLCVQTADTFASSDLVNGPNGRSVMAGANAVLVIPRAPLAAGVNTVSISLPGRSPVTWSFVAAGAPSPALNVSVPWQGADRAVVTWDAPSSDGGDPVGSYVVRVVGGVSITVSGGRGSALVATPNRSPVTVQVIAQNAAGDAPIATGSASSPAQMNTPAADDIVPVAVPPVPTASPATGTDSASGVVSGVVVGSGATAVLANLAMVDSAAPGYVTADRCDALGNGSQQSSSGNHGTGGAVSNLAVVAVDEVGSFCIYTQTATDLVVDVQGQFSPSGALRLSPTSPTRLLDTRNGVMPPAGGIIRVDTGAPPGTAAVLVNLTMVDAASAGYVTALPCSAFAGGVAPSTSSGNHAEGAAVANLAVVAVDPDGSFCLYTQVPTSLVVDLQGTFAPDGTLGFTTSAGTRLLDTRVSGPVGAPGNVVRVQTNASAGTAAVLVNLTMVNGSMPGYITADRCDALSPDVQTKSSGNHGQGGVTANLGVVPVDADGTFCIYSQRAVDLVVDLQGAFAPGGNGFTPMTSTRVLDTRG